MPRIAKVDPEKICKFCGMVMNRKRFNGRIEDMTAFVKRKYCNQLCMAKDYIQRDANLAALRKRAMKFRGNKCEVCGSIKTISIHHLDSNPANNSPDNLMTLCSSCHMKWHWTHGKKMPKRQTICKICGEPSRKLDMCQKHYQRFRKYGDPLLTKKKTGLKYELVRETPGIVNGQASLVLPTA